MTGFEELERMTKNIIKITTSVSNRFFTAFGMTGILNLKTVILIRSFIAVNKNF